MYSRGESPDFRLENNLRDPQTLSSPFLPPQDNDDSSQPTSHILASANHVLSTFLEIQ